MRGRSRLNIIPRDPNRGSRTQEKYRFIVYRFYYYSYLITPPSDYTHRITKIADEIYLSDDTVIGILLKHEPLLADLRQQKPTKAQIQKLFPQFVW